MTFAIFIYQYTETIDQKVSSDSLIKVLLGVEEVQPALAACLFNKIPEYFDNDDDDGRLADSIPRLILSQFKWLEMLMHESKVAQKLLDLVDVAPLHIKREAIAIIPEVAVDDDHREVVDRLRAQLDADPLCTNVILDAFSNLTLDDILQADVAEKVMDLVRSAEPHDLPVVVRYLVQSCTGRSELASKTVAALRNNLNFISAPEHNDDKGKDQGQILTLEALRQGLKFRKLLVSSLIEEIRMVDNADKHSPFDIWALIMLREIGEKKRQLEVDRIFKKKVTDRLFKPGFIRDSIANNSQALRPYFRQFCAVADSLMKAHDNGLGAFGTEVYQVLFELFSDDFSRQEILGNIVSHTGGGDSATVNAALDVLVLLARDHSAALRPFAVFIKGILDYLDNLKPHHIRKLFSVLSMISISGDGGSRELDDDVTIYIRKLLSSSKARYMQYGIIGAVSAIVALSTESRTEISEETQLSAGRNGSIDQATQLLEMVKSKCDPMPGATVCFYDELASAVIAVRACPGQVMNEKSLAWMDENLAGCLEDCYLADLPENGSEIDKITMTDYCASAIKGLHPSLKVRGMFNLDGDDAHMLLDCVKLLMDASDPKREKLQIMCALLRLLGTIEWATKDSLLEIDALAGCPIYAFDDEHIHDFKLLETFEKRQIIQLLFYSCNWIIEVLNTFTLKPDAEMKRKTVLRANHLIQILSTLEQVLEMHTLDLPDLNNSLDADAAVCALSSRPGRPKVKGKAGESSKSAKARTKGKANPKPKSKGKGKEDDSSDDDSVCSSAKPKAKGKGAATGKGKDHDAGENEEGCTASEKGVEAGAFVSNCNNKTKLQVASGTGILTEFVHVRQQACKFRELTITVYNVLAYSGDESHLSGRESSGIVDSVHLDDSTVLALLQDLWSKIDFMVSQRRAFPFGANRGAGQVATARRQLDPLVFFETMRSIWPAIRRIFESVAKRVGASDETMDIDMEKSPDARLQEILLIIMAIVERSLDCTEFLGPHREEHQEVMFLTLSISSSFIEQSSSSLARLDVPAAAAKAYQFFDPFVQQMPTFKLASALIFLQAKVADKAAGEVSESLSEQALWCVTTQWGDSSAKERDVVPRLLACYVSRNTLPIDCISKITSELLPMFDPDDAKEDVIAEGYCKMSGKIFAAIFSTMLEYTTNDFADVEKIALDTANQDPAVLLTRLHTSVQAFDHLIKFVKHWERDSGVLHACIKFGNKVILSFIKIIPSLHRCFKTQQEEIKAVIKQLQASTRALQHMCAHAKVEKDQRVFKLVPLVKRNLETMLFKVKALTEAMGCLAAFSLGNLKHRNLQGQEVCSQVVDEDEDDNSENEEGSDAPTPGRVHKQEEGGSGNDCEDTDSEEAASSHSD